MILDSGLSYALIPPNDFKTLTQMLDTQYGVKCTPEKKKDNVSAQVVSSDCTCSNYNAMPSLKMQIMANGEDKTGKQFVMPRESYIKDQGEGKCQLLLNPNDMQIGARYGEDYWVMGDQFMQSYYTIFDHKNWRVGLVESNNQFASAQKQEATDSDAAKADKQNVMLDENQTLNIDSIRDE